MKITQDVREYAKEQNLEAEKALAVEMAEKAAEFKAMGSEIYQGNVLNSAKEHNYPIFGDEHWKISNAKDLYI